MTPTPSPLFHTLLIANRGEIACRVATTARRLGMRTVAVFSDADAHALHVRLCDEAVHLGPAAASESYLRGDRVIAAALRTGAQAIHPGYGFLSENADFAQACADAGLVFVGPPPSAIAAMGSKSAAKQRMEAAGVPLVPGYHGERQDTAFLQEQAERMGWPVLIKASAGGGGRGMRVVHSAAEFPAALASCQREAAASFGNDQVLVERCLERPRHIEVQVFADTHGHTLHLSERDCSVQRRHQKVLEEAPAPGLSQAVRQALGQAAIDAARSVDYVGAGTVEFIAEHDVATTGRFYFMEMNTRLQVEHPVTEAITGLDLVEWQLRVAAGQALPLTQDQVRLTGHAIEARVCAEDPQRGFLPSVGHLRVLQTPPGAQAFRPGPVRFDSGVVQGDVIGPHYDSMIAKLIVHADTREAALRHMARALDDLHISDVGQGHLNTNVPLLRRLVSGTAFRTADLDTALIERSHAELFDRPPPSLPRAWLAAALMAASHPDAAPAAQAPSPWDATDGWRLGPAGAQRWFDAPSLGPVGLRQGRAPAPDLLHLGDQDVPLRWQRQGPSLHATDGSTTVTLTLGGERRTLQVHRAGRHWEARQPSAHGPLSARAVQTDPLARTATGPAGHGALTTQMPGKVLALHVAPGQRVESGQALVVTEAMKMEHTLSAPFEAVVTEVLCAVGDQVSEGAELLRLQALPPALAP